MNSSTQVKSHNEYLENLKKLWLFSNYIMDKNLEESFVSYLKVEVKNDEVFDNLTSTAASLIKEYEITADDIHAYLKQMIPVV
jgi:outer membrane lipoprotein-sorting protein